MKKEWKKLQRLLMQQKGLLYSHMKTQTADASIVSGICQNTEHIRLMIRASALEYHFQAEILRYSTPEKHIDLGTAMTRYLSSEVAGGFTGVIIGLYASDTDTGWAEFTNFSYRVQAQNGL